MGIISMNMSSLLFGLLPLVAFVVIDNFIGLKAGLFAAIALALAEAAYTVYEFGTLDSFSIASLILVLLFGLLSLRSNNSLYIKLQPVFLGLCFGCVIIAYQIVNQPILILLCTKYKSIIPAPLQSQLQSPTMHEMLRRVSLNLGLGFLAHAALVAYAALHMSMWWWLFIRGIGLYVMMALCVVIARVI